MGEQVSLLQMTEEEWFESGPIKKEMLELWLSLTNKGDK
jgi:hypothetical protein